MKVKVKVYAPGAYVGFGDKIEGANPIHIDAGEFEVDIPSTNDNGATEHNIFVEKVRELGFIHHYRSMSSDPNYDMVAVAWSSDQSEYYYYNHLLETVMIPLEEGEW